jgi:CheY-specific phosphatase CheX/AmiR/NasT family two-component response regulator
MKVGVRMKDIRVVVVDDSPFSIAVLTDMITQSGFTVVGSAGSLEEVNEVISRERPDVVTMDMTIPGTDGLECTRAVHAIDPDIKVIVVSSMMDDEIVRKAKQNKVCGYIQKPVDPEDLSLTISRIMADEELFDELRIEHYTIVKESFLDTFNKFTKTLPELKEENHGNNEQASMGISVAMGIIGKYTGRMIFDMSNDTAEKLSMSVLKRPSKNFDEMLAMMGEFSNIAAGNACSTLNRKNKIFGLRVAPPTIFHGESLNISKIDLEITSSVTAVTAFGDIYISIGFRRGDDEWMSNI